MLIEDLIFQQEYYIQFKTISDKEKLMKLY